MAVDMFLTLDGIKGESVDHKHKDAIDILAWSWGVTQSGSFQFGGGGGSGKANFQDVSVTKYVDKSSADLLYACASGKHLKEASLIVRKAGEKPLEYLIYKLQNIIVTSVSTGGSGGEDRLTENVSLNFAKVSMDYQMQDEKGAGKKAGTFTWDISANQK
ncbi:MAG TPA: type VI secretion system tube protein Hcp [Steroidobacteraceae bacterium]|jgi:type VI secretion system secreted protein Hcp|nr:type VI secretion system tube protein Hcp [Steroidobacteraceae bacterium]